MLSWEGMTCQLVACLAVRLWARRRIIARRSVLLQEFGSRLWKAPASGERVGPRSLPGLCPASTGAVPAEASASGIGSRRTRAASAVVPARIYTLGQRVAPHRKRKRPPRNVRPVSPQSPFPSTAGARPEI